ncbi:hypothetical protein SISNIDRAFT_352601 [Sistotremastrum niveocremeum HHB9708]|uniref:Uncharacterized protein n=1 Tax=Sistotremastrum niveocremeum HHB9708 TaxID=1314777 RepID=A0A164X3H8_9AGAM|nr:hypothetical protein SISNIDRAFT_352601 [Sistotremastrum niveocremeum HHB9708]
MASAEKALGGELKVEADGQTLRWTLDHLHGQGPANGHVGKGVFHSYVGSEDAAGFVAGTYTLKIHGQHADLRLVDADGLIGVFSGEGKQQGLDGDYEGSYKRA